MTESFTRVRCPALYQLNTGIRLAELGRALGRPATLDDIPDSDLDGLAAAGFDWLWLLGVWQTGKAGRQVSMRIPALMTEFQRLLPDLTAADIPGSCFAIKGYHAGRALGGNPALARIRKRLHKRGMRLLLDFVPNHTALDHPWVQTHPDYYIHGSADDLANAPQNFCRQTSDSPVLAYGRDPHFPGWTDTLQLNYANPGTGPAMASELLRIAGQCDGVRCDMAMLMLPEVFARTWGLHMAPFWPQAIAAVRRRYPDFLLMAEVYWDLEWELQQQGFDYTYDKRLYDRLRDGRASAVRDHLRAGLDFQHRLTRFLENHDEARAAAVFPFAQHCAAAIVTFLSPGLRFFHHGQNDGCREHIPVHLNRGPVEPTEPEVQAFYGRLRECLRRPVLRDGDWQLLDAHPAWAGSESAAGFLVWSWALDGESRLLIAVNYAPSRGQCYVPLPWYATEPGSVRLRDAMGPALYHRDPGELAAPGLYLDLPAWGYHVFELAVDEAGKSTAT
jgi:glycosidase